MDEESKKIQEAIRKEEEELKIMTKDQILKKNR